VWLGHRTNCSHQASQGSQVEPDVDLEGEGFALEIAVDGQSLEAPAFEEGVAGRALGWLHLWFESVYGARFEETPRTRIVLGAFFSALKGER